MTDRRNWKWKPCACRTAFLAAAAFLVFTSSAVPFPVQRQERKSPEVEGAKQRWEALTPETRRRLLERYRSFRSLPEAERRRLRERYQALETIRRSLDLPEKPRDPRKLEAWKREVNRRVRRFLETRVHEVKERLGQGAPTGAGTPPDKERRARLRALRERLQQLNRVQLDRFLDRIVKEGILPPAEAEVIRSLDPVERRRRIFELGKKHLLRELEGLLPPRELKQLQALDPFRFHRWRREGRIPVDLFRVVKHLFSLTPEQRAALEQTADGPARRRKEEAFQRKNLLERLARLGVKRAEIENVLDRPVYQRRRWIMDRVRALRRKADTLSPEARRLLGLPPRGPKRTPPGRPQEETPAGGGGGRSKEKGAGGTGASRGKRGAAGPSDPQGKRLHPPLRSL